MATGGQANDDADFVSFGEERTQRRYSVLVTLNDEQMAAAEGWRSAHGIVDQAEALGELIRLGLLSEIAKIYRLVSDNRTPAASGRQRNGSLRETAAPTPRRD